MQVGCFQPVQCRQAFAANVEPADRPEARKVDTMISRWNGKHATAHRVREKLAGQAARGTKKDENWLTRPTSSLYDDLIAYPGRSLVPAATVTISGGYWETWLNLVPAN
jgi:hypothetical protein